MEFLKLKRFKNKWTGPESNRRHTAFQAVALPTELPVLFQKQHKINISQILIKPKTRLFSVCLEYYSRHPPPPRLFVTYYISPNSQIKNTL